MRTVQGKTSVHPGCFGMSLYRCLQVKRIANIRAYLLQSITLEGEKLSQQTAVGTILQQDAARRNPWVRRKGGYASPSCANPRETRKGRLVLEWSLSKRPAIAKARLDYITDRDPLSHYKQSSRSIDWCKRNILATEVAWRRYKCFVNWERNRRTSSGSQDGSPHLVK